MRFLLVLMACLCGCSTAATITLGRGRQYEGRIRGGDAEVLVVETESGLEVPIPRGEIAGIDHPGNGTATIGALLGAYGGLVFVKGIGRCGTEDEVAVGTCIGAVLPATVGVSMFIWGLVTWMGSKSAADGDGAPVSGLVPDVPQASAFDFASPMLPPGR